MEELLEGNPKNMRDAEGDFEREYLSPSMAMTV
jgi:hypothetical protein